MLLLALTRVEGSTCLALGAVLHEIWLNMVHREVILHGPPTSRPHINRPLTSKRGRHAVTPHQPSERGNDQAAVREAPSWPQRTRHEGAAEAHRCELP